MKDIKKFEDTLNSLLDWQKRQAIEFDYKNINLSDFSKKQAIVNKLKKELIEMFEKA